MSRSRRFEVEEITESGNDRALVGLFLNGRGTGGGGPIEEHWHGAAPARFMTHIAMLDLDTRATARPGAIR